MTNKNPWADIARRAQEATGPDRELDAAIHEAAGLPFVMEYWSKSDTKPSRNLSYVPHYTGSVDTILALIADKLPGAVWHVMTDYGGLNRAKVGPVGRPSATIYDVDWQAPFIQADAETPALALTAAFALAMDAHPLPADGGGQP